MEEEEKERENREEPGIIIIFTELQEVTMIQEL